MSCFDSRPECAPPSPSTPLAVYNRPGLTALVRRVGTHARFKQAMLDAIARHPGLARLAARDDADPSIGLIDAWATALDVLTFYQERIADEGYLLTAKERRSTLELARAIGYELGQGVAATALLAVTVETSPGGTDAVPLAAGLRVQSIPGPDELPQTYESVEDLRAHVAFNAMAARRVRPPRLTRDSTSVWLAGSAVNVKPGDMLLLVGPNRMAYPSSERWDARVILHVESRPDLDSTRVSWGDALGHVAPAVEPSARPTAYVFRRRAALFGHNAPDFRGIPETVREGYGIPESATQWPNFEITTVNEQRIDLDAAYPDIIEGSWILLEKPSYRELYRVTRVRTGARTDFTLTAKTTQLWLDAREHLSWFPLRETVVHAQSDALPFAPAPITEAVWGDRIELDQALPPLDAERRLIVRGRPLERVRVGPRGVRRRSGATTIEEPAPLLILRASSGATRALNADQLLEITATPVALPDGLARWALRDPADGFEGTLDADADDLIAVEDPPPPAFVPPDESMLEAELAILARTESGPDGVTILVLRQPLARVYQRGSVLVHANVVKATHGASVEVLGNVVRTAPGARGAEPIGSGDNARGMQAFALRQKPVTYVSDPLAPGGAASTISIRVDGLLWQPVRTLYDQAPDARVYSVRHADDGTAVVQFGDGTRGARLPAGQDNVTAHYRVGTGLAGQVRAGQLSLLMSKPLGVKAVINPLAASGAEDPETLDQARANAPLTVLTLDRIVSVRDAEDFARAFAGVGKAQARVLWNGERRMIHLSIAQADQTPLDPEGELANTLRAAIDAARPADQEIRVDGYELRRFGVAARIAVHPDHEVAAVLDACRTALLDAWSFGRRDFAHSVHVAELAAALQAVPGVSGAGIRTIDGLDPLTTPRLDALPARWNTAGTNVLPAQLVLIDPTRIDLQEWT